VATTIGWDVLVTILIFVAIKYTIGIRVSVDEEMSGLDESQHGEHAYAG
jgi:ammonium transporter, Amt family